MTLTLDDLLGYHVHTLVDSEQAVGKHHVAWNGIDATSHMVASGVYFYQFRVHEAATSKQAIRIR